MLKEKLVVELSAVLTPGGLFWKPNGKKSWTTPGNAARALSFHVPGWRHYGYQIVTRIVEFESHSND